MNFFSYCEGKRHNREGKGLEDNPYHLGTVEWLSWRKGWENADNEE